MSKKIKNFIKLENNFNKRRKMNDKFERGEIYADNLGIFSVLPEPIILNIFSFLDFDVKYVRLTCKLFYRLGCQWWKQTLPSTHFLPYYVNIRKGKTYVPHTLILPYNILYLESLLNYIKELNLKGLEIKNCENYSSSVIKSILINSPPTLTHISIPTIYYENIKYLPPKLETLTSAQLHLFTIQTILNLPKNINISEKNTFESVINYAIRNDYQNLFLELLKKGADINKPDISNTTPLVNSIHRKRFEMTKTLLENGASVKIHCEIHSNIINCAILTKSIMLMDLLIQYGANIKEDNSAFLKSAIFIKDEDMIDYLVKKGVYIPPNVFHMILHSSIGNKYHHLLSLLENGANPNFIENNLSSLYIACMSGDPDIVSLLLLNNADVNVGDVMNKETPLHISVKKKFFTISFLLLLNRADVYLKNIYGKTPLDIAVSNANPPFIILLKAYLTK
jgi:ankyrin repeat protein